MRISQKSKVNQPNQGHQPWQSNSLCSRHKHSESVSHGLTRRNIQPEATVTNDAQNRRIHINRWKAKKGKEHMKGKQLLL